MVPRPLWGHTVCEVLGERSLFINVPSPEDWDTVSLRDHGIEALVCLCANQAHLSHPQRRAQTASLLGRSVSVPGKWVQCDLPLRTGVREALAGKLESCGPLSAGPRSGLCIRAPGKWLAGRIKDMC